MGVCVSPITNMQPKSGPCSQYGKYSKVGNMDGYLD